MSDKIYADLFRRALENSDVVLTASKADEFSLMLSDRLWGETRILAAVKGAAAGPARLKLTLSREEFLALFDYLSPPPPEPEDDDDDYCSECDGVCEYDESRYSE